MIFQDPMTSLNPVYRVGGQIVEAIQAHERSRQGGRPRPGRRPAAPVGIPQAERSASTTTRTSSRAACASG